MADLGVLIIADDPLARAGVATLLTDRAGYTIVGQVAGDVDLAAAIDNYHPDVVVWDLGRDPRPSLEHLPDLRDAGLGVVALVPNESHAAGALSAGAQGLLLRDVDSASLLAALTAVSRGLVIVDPSLGVARPRVPDRGGSSLAEELTLENSRCCSCSPRVYPTKASPNVSMSANTQPSFTSTQFWASSTLRPVPRLWHAPHG